jgi:hypothetical protein
MPFLIVASILMIASVSVAADPPEGQVVQFTVHPAAPPVPALKYRLLPDELDRTPGNAAPIYLAAMQMPIAGTDTCEWRDLPLEDLRQPEITEFFEANQQGLLHLEVAARRDRAGWEPIHRELGYASLWPHVNAMRQFSFVIAPWVRLQIANGEHAEAIRALRTGLSMAKHLEEDGMLVHGLVAGGIATMLMERVEELVQQPAAPNMYWALTHLPRPFVDGRALMERERALFYFHFPQLRDVRPRSLSADQWIETWSQVHALLGTVFLADGAAAMETHLTAVSKDLHPRARQRLVERGLDQHQVTTMPPEEAVGLYFVHTFQEMQDEVHKWFGLPARQALAGLDDAAARIMANREAQPQNALLQLVTLANRVPVATGQLDRRIAMLQCVEAIRAYAAANEGRVPTRLDDLVDTPAPIDPMTGQPFEYRVEDGRAILDAPAPPDPQWAVRYVITIAE